LGGGHSSLKSEVPSPKSSQSQVVFWMGTYSCLPLMIR
jgi:hypothetical protein